MRSRVSLGIAHTRAHIHSRHDESIGGSTVRNQEGAPIARSGREEAAKMVRNQRHIVVVLDWMLRLIARISPPAGCSDAGFNPHLLEQTFIPRTQGVQL